MNYLAHILFSGGNEEIQIGNFIGDAVKGKYDHFPEGIRKGIFLHRKMDVYADQHPNVREAVMLLKPEFERYSAVLVDIFFDYFLAVNFEKYSDSSLRNFAWAFYWNLIRHYRILPPRIKGFLWHFILTNRLCRYASLSGIQSSLTIMVEYRYLGIDPHEAVSFLQDNSVLLNKLSLRFFDDLQGENLVEKRI